MVRSVLCIGGNAIVKYLFFVVLILTFVSGFLLC